MGRPQALDHRRRPWSEARRSALPPKPRCWTSPTSLSRFSECVPRS